MKTAAKQRKTRNTFSRTLDSLRDALYNVEHQRDALREELRKLREENGVFAKQRFGQLSWQVNSIELALKLRHPGKESEVLDVVEALVKSPVVQIEVGVDLQFQRPKKNWTIRQEGGQYIAEQKEQAPEVREAHQNLEKS